MEILTQLAVISGSITMTRNGAEFGVESQIVDRRQRTVHRTSNGGQLTKYGVRIPLPIAFPCFFCFSLTYTSFAGRASHMSYTVQSWPDTKRFKPDHISIFNPFKPVQIDRDYNFRQYINRRCNEKEDLGGYAQIINKTYSYGHWQVVGGGGLRGIWVCKCSNSANLPGTIFSDRAGDRGTRVQTKWENGH